MKTVTLWNVPLEIADMCVNVLRAKVAQMIIESAPMSEVEKILWNIQSIEDEMKERGTEE